MLKTTKEDFNVFCKTFRECQRKLNLMDYRVTFEHARLKGAYADVAPDVQNRVATVRLSTHIDPCESVEKLAKHEAGHLFLAKLSSLIPLRTYDEEAATATEEATVIVLTELL